MGHPHDRSRPADAHRGAEMRISDAERAEVTEALCRHYADGRLDHAELEERTAAAARAKTRAELAPLLADLPPLPGRPPAPAPERRQLPRPLFLAVAAVVAVVWWWALWHAATHAFLLWVAVGLAFMVLRRHRRYGAGRPL